MEEEPPKNDRYVVPAVKQAFRVLFCLATGDSSHMSLNEICRRVDIHKSKAFSILHTLQGFGVVQRNNEGRGYSLGPGLVSLSRGFLDKLNAPRLAAPIVTELSKKTGNTVVFGMIADRHVFVVAKHEGEQGIAITMRLGQRFPLTYGSHGKAIAAVLPEKELDLLLKEERSYFHGDPSRFDAEKLKEEIEQCRRDGFAVDLGEVVPGVATVAAPVTGVNGVPIGYIVLIGLFQAEAVLELGPLVAEAGRALSRQLGTGQG
ncbi:MAG: IclR family transcriptional regulator [Syntrophorhabdales bacterium]|jgi:DNA-binding IclR family transcriptional regulator